MIFARIWRALSAPKAPATLAATATLSLLLPALSACSDRTSPFGYRRPKDMIAAALGQRTCMHQEGLFDGMPIWAPDEDEQCYRFKSPERMQGVLIAGGEESLFFENARSPPEGRLPRDPRQLTWLRPSAAALAQGTFWRRASDIDFSKIPPGRVSICPQANEMTFIGRRAMFPGRYGHMGMSANLILADRVLSVRELPYKQPPSIGRRPGSVC